MWILRWILSSLDWSWGILGQGPETGPRHRPQLQQQLDSNSPAGPSEPVPRKANSEVKVPLTHPAPIITYPVTNPVADRSRQVGSLSIWNMVPPDSFPPSSHAECYNPRLLVFSWEITRSHNQKLSLPWPIDHEVKDLYSGKKNGEADVQKVNIPTVQCSLTSPPRLFKLEAQKYQQSRARHLSSFVKQHVQLFVRKMSNKK